MIAIGEGPANFNVLLIGLTHDELATLYAGGSINQVMTDGEPVARIMLIAGESDAELEARTTRSAQAAGKEVVRGVDIDRDGKPS